MEASFNVSKEQVERQLIFEKEDQPSMHLTDGGFLIQEGCIEIRQTVAGAACLVRHGFDLLNRAPFELQLAVPEDAPPTGMTSSVGLA